MERKVRRDPQGRLAEWEYAEDGSWVRVIREWEEEG